MKFLRGSDLRKMRGKSGLTTSECARIAGVKTRKTYENWEKDVGTPDFNQFVRLCIGYGFKSTFIVGQLLRRAESLDDETLPRIELDLDSVDAKLD